VRLETERLRLRPLALDDLDAIASLYSDPEVIQYLGVGKPLSHEDSERSVQRMVRSWEVDGFGQVAVERKDDGTFVGRCGFLVWDAATLTTTTEAEATGPTELEVGYALEQQHWGRGYATEAALAVRDHAFGPMGRKRLIAFIRHDNVRSQRVAEKLGMRHERDVMLMDQPAQLFAVEA
jgi:ribosomal-protein-alanine N-acetyltransferase